MGGLGELIEALKQEGENDLFGSFS
jgi:hypothetical protein